MRVIAKQALRQFWERYFSDADADRAFARLEELWAADDGTPEADELEALSLLIKKYEDNHYPVGSSHSA